MGDEDLIRRGDALEACAPHYQATLRALPAAPAEEVSILRARVEDQATEIARLTRIIQMQPPAIKPAAPAEDVRAGAHQAGMILGLQMAADIASAHDYTIQSSSAADLRAVQICNAILALIPGEKP